ncbi:DivIVA domain-containing protein [Saccharothrix hoggarensis]|uniref:DivIVA domain-containing protein n=1 Tax=Saccharothrix hoggarensis TaxID=913853 RepID=A0ABW3QWX9_9PSEU
MHIDESQGIPFRVRLRGYDRQEVDEELARLRRELDVLRVDRDAAVATADDLIRQLEEARSELAEYRVLHAGYSKDNAVSGCIRYLMHVARQKADAFETDARERSEQMLKRAEEVARQQAVLLDETEQETQRRLADAEQRAREIVQRATAEAGALLAGQVDQQDRWTPETAAALDVPVPRLTSGPLQVIQPDTEEQRPTTA